jgi:hypothetical protein
MRGSIYRRGEVYTVKIELPRRADGRRKYRYDTVTTRKEAERLRAKLVADLNAGAYFEPSTMAFGAYLDYWLAQTGGGLAATSRARCRSIIDQHLKPALGHHPLAKLTPRRRRGHEPRCQRRSRRADRRARREIVPKYRTVFP